MLFAAILLMGSSASAQEVDPEVDERARVHFESGRVHFEDGAYERAEEEFRSAYQLSHRPELLMNIATSVERLGRYAEAADLIEQFLADAADVPNRESLERRVANLRARAAGTADDVQPVEERVASADGTSVRTIGAIAAFGVAGAGVATFAILGGLALAERGGLEDGCGMDSTCGDDEVGGLRGLSLGADISLVVAGVAAVTGVLVLLLVKDGASPEHAALAPWVGTDGAGVAYARRF
jgi:hypothetical protein